MSLARRTTGIRNSSMSMANTTRRNSGAIMAVRNCIPIPIIALAEIQNSTVQLSSDCAKRITSLQSLSGPGVELLEYLTPRSGQPFPADERANDIVHRQTE